MRTINWNKKFSHVTHLYKKLNYLKLNEIYHLELAKFMHKICYNKLPLLFQQRFNKIELVHSHQTRKVTNLNYFLPRVSKTAGQKKLEFWGAKLWNEIDEDIKHKTFNSLKKCFKEKIVSHYWLGFDSSGTEIKLIESSSTTRILMRVHSFFFKS